MPLCVGLGELLWDELHHCSGCTRKPGGAPANFAAHAAALGADARLITAVGTDADGDALIKEMVARKVDVSAVQRNPDHRTGSVTVIASGDAPPRYTIHEDVAWDFIEPAAPAVRAVTEADAIAFGSLAQRAPVSRASIRQLLQNAEPACLRVCDLNLRTPFYSREILEGSCQQANIVKVSDEELPEVARLLELPTEREIFARALLEKYELQLVALTLGAEGSLLVNRGSAHRQPAVATNIVDTVGAGDAFTATLVLGLLARLDLKPLSALANEVAAFVCSAAGATPALPAEFARRISSTATGR